MDELNIVNSLHTATERDYLDRVNSVDKAWAAEKASKWGYDYWDGSRQTGYGGYKYDGRWKTVADQLIKKYQLKEGAKILDVGCGKGFLMHDLRVQIPEIEVTGIDVSGYALENALETVKSNCHLGCASELPFTDDTFDLVCSCIEQVFSEEESWAASDCTKKELHEFLEQLDSSQFKKIEQFFETMPKLSHTLNVTNPNTKVVNKITLEGLNAFFG